MLRAYFDNASSSERSAFWRDFFEDTRRSIYNVAVFFQGLTATLQMMTQWNSTSDTEQAVQALLLKEYESRYALAKDREINRVLKLEQDTDTKESNLKKRLLLEKSVELLQLWQVPEPEVLRTKQNEFVLHLSLSPSIHHLDFSSFSFNSIDQSLAFQQFIKELLGCNPHITRITVHSDDVLNSSLTQTIDLHRQLFIAHELLTEDNNSQSIEKKRQIQEFYLKNAPRVINTQLHETTKKLNFLDRIASQQSYVTKVISESLDTVSSFFNNGFSSLSFFQVPKAPVWDSLRHGVKSANDRLNEALKCISELTLAVSVHTYRTGPRNVEQQTQEMQRILAFWREYKVLATPREKDQRREKIFSDIYNAGEEVLFPLFAPDITEPVVPREKQKALYTHKYNEAAVRQFYGDRAEAIIADYKEASRIRSDDEMVQWIAKTKLKPSNIVIEARRDANFANRTTRVVEEQKILKADLNEFAAGVSELRLEQAETARAVNKWLAAMRNNPCIARAQSLPSMDATQCTTNNQPRSLSDGASPGYHPLEQHLCSV